jgi:dihydrofolate reductase
MSGGVSAAEPRHIAIVLLAAVADNGVIGRDNALPFRQSSDLKRFKAMTMGKPVVMGRKTWDSLPRKPLPDRLNIVVTRQTGWNAAGAVVASSLEEALAKSEGAADVMIIGGSEIYREALPIAGRIELTEVHRAFDGDAHFAFDRKVWREVAREDHATPDGIAYSYVTLIRI